MPETRFKPTARGPLFSRRAASTRGINAWFLGAFACATLLIRILWLERDLPFGELGASGAFLLDEGAYQLSALHRVLHGSWRLEETHYFGWTIRAYQLWLAPFLGSLGPDLFAMRLASVLGQAAGLLILLAAAAKHVSKPALYLFGLLIAVNFPLAMWSRMASPYPVSLFWSAAAAWLFMAGISASPKAKVLQSIGVAVCVSLAVWTKESAIFFLPVFLAALVYRDRMKAAPAGAYFVCAAGLIGAIVAFYLSPESSAWWNGTAENAASGVAAFKHPSITWLKRIYLNVFELPVHANYPLLMVAACGGMGLSLLRMLDSNESEQVWDALMLTWLVGGASFLAIGNIGMSEAVLITPHYSQLLLPPICWFAAVALAEPLRKEPKLSALRWAILGGALCVFTIPALRTWWKHGTPFDIAFGQGIASLKLLVKAACLALAAAAWFAGGRPHLSRKFGSSALLVVGLIALVGVDLARFAIWAAQSRQRNSLPAVASQFERSALAQSRLPRPVVLQLDTMFLAGRAPRLETLGLRSFHLDHLSRIEARWRPEFIVLMRREGETTYGDRMRADIDRRGFKVDLIEEAPLGWFDGWVTWAQLYKLAAKAGPKT